MELPEELNHVVDTFRHPLVFVTVSGAHLYGFPSPDSDFDLRGCHVLPIETVVGLGNPRETEERLGPESGLDLDLVSHDIDKFCRMLLKPNGYVLEQLTSPLVLRTSPEHEALKALVPQLLTRHHAHHYLGFAHNQWGLFEKAQTVKALLYVYRVLLTGIHLMRSGELQASLPVLLQDYPQVGVEDLLAAKTSGAEKQKIAAGERERHAVAFAKLVDELKQARDASYLPDHHSAFDALNHLLVRRRLLR